MKPSEAISQLESLNKEVSIYSDAIELAISALEAQEQDGDLISRRAAIDAVNRAITKEAARWSIQELPSAQQWIPVSERMPDEDLWTGRGKQFSDSALMTVTCKDGDDYEILSDYGHTVDGEWYSETVGEFIEAPWRVVAWMPLPEPYEGEQE